MDDSSLMSGISNLSRISKASNSIFYKFDSTCNISEWRSMCRDINKSFTNDTQYTDLKKITELKKMNKSFKSYEESIYDYTKLKLIYQCLKYIVFGNNSLIENNTKNKLKKIIIIFVINKYLHLPNNSIELKEELTLLGIIDLPKYEFNYEEQVAIRRCLEINLREKINKFLEMYIDLIGSTKEILKYSESILFSYFHQKIQLKNIHWKDKIDEVCLEYKRDLLHCLKMLDRWNELKVKIHDKNLKDIENLLLQTEIVEMKTIITKLSCSIRIYTETPISVEAFKILNLRLQEKINNVTEKIIEKNKLIKLYKIISSTEYDEILRKYLNLCHIVKKKKNLLNNL